MIALSLLLHLFAASFLLLIAVKMVRKGIEESFAQTLHQLLKSGQSSGVGLLAGCGLAIMLQGATAVLLLTSGLISSGVLQLASGLAIAIGADIGSAIVVRILTFDISWLSPLLLFAGGWLYLYGKKPRSRSIGRSVVGVSLILLSLEMIGTAVQPLKDAAFLPSLASYLESDLVTAFLLGIAITFALHSSVASILVCVTLVASETFSLSVGIAFILGANFGSALIPVWLTRSSDPIERQLPLLNLAVRASAACTAMIPLWYFGLETFFFGDGSNENHVILAHLAFNLCLAPLVLIAGPLARITVASTTASYGQQNHQRRPGVIDAEANEMGHPPMVMKRDVLAMLDIVSGMISNASKYLHSRDDALASIIFDDELTINHHLDCVRTYYARTAHSDAAKKDAQRLRELLEYAVRLEHAADVISKRIVPTVQALSGKGRSLSTDDLEQLSGLNEMVLGNSLIAFEVVSTQQIERAEDLVARKEKTARTEQRGRKKHFKQLAQGSLEALATSNAYLDLSAALKEINSKLATIAYTFLDAKGRLNNTRLIEE